MTEEQREAGIPARGLDCAQRVSAEHTTFLRRSQRAGPGPREKTTDARVSFPAVVCPGIEAQLAEHVTWRLVSGSLNEYGAQVVLSCSPGYYLEGRRLVQCQANGTWSAGDSRPRCRGECRLRPAQRPHGAGWWRPPCKHGPPQVPK